MEMNGGIIVTGATGGMGSAAVEALARQGVPVLMACRNLQKAETVRADILSRGPGARLQLGLLDLSSMASVRAFAEHIEPGAVSALFNNAGVISKGFHLTEDGLENTFSVDYFGPWLLTQLLLPKLPQDARIVNMVSLTCRFVSIDEAALRPAPGDFSQLGTYARAKRALVSFSMELARRYPSLQVNLADPGIVASDMIDLGHWFDPLADVLFKPLCKSPQAGVQPAIRALLEGNRNRYYVGKQRKAIPARYIDPALDQRIWEETRKRIQQ
ncbi:MAG: SDR family NAD(P)-dependent oxidoreductase [Bacteroidales bacterium]|nr:SDR family NAD(P)-dependent oxidoreductase [Bacteroidales bacterium]